MYNDSKENSINSLSGETVPDTQEDPVLLKKWESLTISSDFIFGKVMLDKGLCLELIRLILPELDIKDISDPEIQKTIKPDVATPEGIAWNLFTNFT